ncbi:hypothetical protein FXO37_31028 [Capsicum annuum]|nr:hypothetical protein FXO37_31028 [Capsicum annuum]
MTHRLQQIRDISQVEMPIDNPADLTGDFVFKSLMGILKHRIKYRGDDEDLKEEDKNMDEIWINYCGKQKLKPSSKKGKTLTKQPPIKTNKGNEKIVELLTFVRPSYKVKKLLADLQNKNIQKKYKKPLCLIWLGHLKSFLTFDSRSEGTRMRFLIQGSSGIVQTKPDLMVDLIKKELARERAIKRAARKGQFVLDEPHVEDLNDQPFGTSGGGGGSDGDGVGDEVGDSVTGGVGDTGAKHADVENVVDARVRNLFEIRVEHDDGGGLTPFSGPSLSLCSVCKCQECKDRHEELIERIDDLTTAVKKLTSKRCFIP